MAAPTIAASSIDKTGNTNADLTFTFASDGPSGIVAGSLCVAHITLNGASTTPAFATPGTWNKAQESIGATGGNKPGTAVFWRIMDGTETTVTFTATPNATTSGMVGKVLRITGHDPVTPINTSSTTAADTALASSYVLNGVTTTVDDCLVLSLTGSMAASVRTVTPPITVSEIYDFGADPGDAASQAGATETRATAGATGTRTFTISANAFNAGVAIAIAPEPALVEGDIGQTLPATTQALDLDALVEGDAAQTLPAATQALAGEIPAEGDITQTLPPVTQSVSATRETFLPPQASKQMPELIMEVGFTAGADLGDALILDDPARGLLDTAELVIEDFFTDVTQFMRSASLTRGSTRVQGPVVRYEAGTATAVLRNEDRRFDPTNLDGPYVTDGESEVEPMRTTRWRATWDGETYDLWRGFVDSWTFTYAKKGNYSQAVIAATDGFKVLRANDLAASGAVGAGEDSGARVSRLLDAASWSAFDRQISDGDTTLQATTLAANTLTELFQVADTELGELYMDGAGRVVFRNRHALLTEDRSNTVQATFGDDASLGELTFSDLTLEFDEEQLVNIARIAREGGTQQTAEDAASVAKYLPHTFERTDLLMESDVVAADYAAFLVFVGKDAELRFSELVIDPQRDPDNLFPQVLGRQIGDRIQINLRPAGGGDPIEREVFVRGIAHQITRTTWQTTWTLQSASRFSAAFILDDVDDAELDADALTF